MGNGWTQCFRCDTCDGTTEVEGTEVIELAKAHKKSGPCRCTPKCPGRMGVSYYPGRNNMDVVMAEIRKYSPNGELPMIVIPR